MAKKMDAEKASRKRSNATALTIVEAGLSDLAGIGAPVAMIRRLVEHALEVRVERRERRILDLHRMILSGRTEAEAARIVTELVDAEGSRETYEALLESAIDDEEEAKVPFYATALRVLAVERTIETKFRRHLIKTLRALTVEDLELLFRLVAEGRKVQQQFGAEANSSEIGLPLNHLLRLRDPQTTLSVQALVAHGMLREPGEDSTAHALTIFAQLLVHILES